MICLALGPSVELYVNILNSDINIAHSSWVVSSYNNVLSKESLFCFPGGILLTRMSLQDPESYGCLLELTWNAQKPLTLTPGSERKFLEDGDEVILTACCKVQSTHTFSLLHVSVSSLHFLSTYENLSGWIAFILGYSIRYVFWYFLKEKKKIIVVTCFPYNLYDFFLIFI